VNLVFNCTKQIAVCLAQLSGDSAVVSSVFLNSEGTAVCWGPRQTGFVFTMSVRRFGELCFF
jgi:hypothetical protein